MTPVPFGPTDFFALLKAAGNFQTRFAQTVKIPFTASFPVLNKCQWEFFLGWLCQCLLKLDILNKIYLIR